MNDLSKKKRPSGTVCLFWAHPLMRSDFCRLLSGNGLKVFDRRLGIPWDGVEVPLPRAGVYVLEALSDFDETRAIVARFLARRPLAKFVVVAERFDQNAAFTLLRLGVKGLLRYDEASTHVRKAIHEVLHDGFWVPRSVLSRFIDSTVRALNPIDPRLLTAQSSLSRRENEVCGLVLENLSNREIASRLAVSERTAKFHVANVLAKYGLKRRTELVLLSYSQGRDRAMLTRSPRPRATAARTS
jgi:DNA-binding NarL/FixJ family response regulator